VLSVAATVVKATLFACAVSGTNNHVPYQEVLPVYDNQPRMQYRTIPIDYFREAVCLPDGPTRVATALFPPPVDRAAEN